MGNNKKLVWDAKDYTNSNSSQQRDAVELIEEIEKEGTNNIEIIVDIGCGPGNVTEQLSKRIPHKKVYASDFDPQMISYAEKNHNDGTIEYFVQDIGLPWEKLDEKLKVLEGKVDLVWSNRVLHWVKDKATALKTIARLLKPGGRFYINVTFVRDPFHYSEENKKKYEKFYKVDSHEKQLEVYKSVFPNLGLSHFDIRLLNKHWNYETEKQYNEMFTCIETYWEMSLIPPVDFSSEEIKALIKTMCTVGNPSFNLPYDKNSIDKLPENKLRTYYEQGRFTGTK